jgi:hypothetical protein
MIIVMLLIASITGALAYSYRDTLDEGKAFKTRQGIKRIEAILIMYVYENPDAVSKIEENWKTIVSKSTLGVGANGTCELLKDGWGNEYTITHDTQDGETVLHVKSSSLERFESRHSAQTTKS